MKTLVLGLGNPVLTDDGVGWHVVRVLRPLLEGRSDVEVEESCRGGLGLMEQMVGYDRVIVVDAILTGGEPGTLHYLTPESIPTRNSASGHDANLPTALEVGRKAGARLPRNEDILLIGIEAADVETFSENCTPAVEAVVRDAAEAVVAAIDTERSQPWR
jgi:hydrogenase maturation protease